MYREYIYIFSYFQVAKYPIAKQRVKNHGNIIAYTLWILSDCASDEVIYIMPASRLTLFII
jgi:hypothetical protein